MKLIAEIYYTIRRYVRMKEVVITSGYSWSYFEWFLLGFQELAQQGKIKFRSYEDYILE